MKQMQIWNQTDVNDNLNRQGDGFGFKRMETTSKDVILSMQMIFSLTEEIFVINSISEN